MRVLFAVVLFASCAAFAQADAPKVEAPAPAPASAPVTPSESKVSLSDRTLPSIWLQAGAGAGAALISVPIALYVAGGIGSLTNNVYLALVEAFLIGTFLPSLAVTAAVVGIGNYYLPGTFPFWRVWGLTSVASALAWVIGVVSQAVSVGAFGSIILFAICEAILLPAVAVPSARWLAKPPPAAQLASLEPWNPGAAQRWFLPAAEVSF